MIRKALPDLVAFGLLLSLPLLLFAPVALGSRTLLPADALFLFEPYQAVATKWGVSFPHNHLLADMVLENYAWKRLLVEALQSGELPLWDPYIFAGHRSGERMACSRGFNWASLEVWPTSLPECWAYAAWVESLLAFYSSSAALWSCRSYIR